MKIIITNAYSLDQKGDSALLTGTIDQLQKCFPAATLCAQIMGKTKAGDTYENIPVIESLVYAAVNPGAPKYIKIFHLIFVPFTAIAWALTTRLTTKMPRFFLTSSLFTSLKSIATADLVVPVAGGYFSAKPGFLSTINLLCLTVPLWVAYILQKPVILFSQSIGPLATPFQKKLLALTLRPATLIITRESKSTQFTINLGIEPKKIYQSIDVGFLFTPDARFQLQDAFTKPLPPRPYVGITTKVHFTTALQKKYEQEMAQFADWLCFEKQMTVIFIPQITSTQIGEDDRIINKRIWSLMKYQSLAFTIEKDLTNHQTKSVINSLDYLVGTRFHSVIFALTGLVPAIAIEYEHKTSGIMHDLNLDQWVIKIDAITSHALSLLFNKLETQKVVYQQHLKEVLPPYLKHADEVRHLIKQSADHALSAR